jgi:hypothetical protein
MKNRTTHFTDENKILYFQAVAFNYTKAITFLNVYGGLKKFEDCCSVLSGTRTFILLKNHAGIMTAKAKSVAQGSIYAALLGLAKRKVQAWV